MQALSLQETCGWLRVLILLGAASSAACQQATEAPPAPHASAVAPPPADVSPLPLAEPECADVNQLSEVVGVAPDPVEVALVDVDRAVEQDLPVRAAGILTDRVLPASFALLAQLRALDPRSPLGAALQQQWVSACAARDVALTGYADALARGIVEDLTLADALRDQRRAGDAMAEARAALAEALLRIDASAEGE